MRPLRSYQYMAMQTHWCDRCLSPILPGESYEGTVYATDHGILVIKMHVYPMCDYPPDPDYDEKDEIQIPEESPLSEAA